MDEVDDVLDVLADELARRDEELAEAPRQQRDARPQPAGADRRMGELHAQISTDVTPERLWAVATDWANQGQWIPFTRARIVGDGPPSGRIARWRRGPASVGWGSSTS